MCENHREGSFTIEHDAWLRGWYAQPQEGSWEEPCGGLAISPPACSAPACGFSRGWGLRSRPTRNRSSPPIPPWRMPSARSTTPEYRGSGRAVARSACGGARAVGRVPSFPPRRCSSRSRQRSVIRVIGRRPSRRAAHARTCWRRSSTIPRAARPLRANDFRSRRPMKQRFSSWASSI